MSDIVSPEVRSRMMSAIRGKNTGIETVVRKGLFALGFRYRLHLKTLPGKPDVVLPKHRAVIFVHGCFWHGHSCALFRKPKTNADFWETKINRNRIVDQQHIKALRSAGWRVLTVWECCLRGRYQLGLPAVVARMDKWLRSKSVRGGIRGGS